MNKQIIVTLTILVFSTSSFAQQMKEKKVCNTLENGAEFCTVFKVPVDNKIKKTEEEINQDLAKKSELVLNKKENKSSIRENTNLTEIQDEQVSNKGNKDVSSKKAIEAKKQEEIQQLKRKEKELALAKEKEEKELAKKKEEEAREKKIALEKEKKREARLEEIKIKKKEKELAKKKEEESARKKEKELTVEKDKSNVIENKKEETTQAVKVEVPTPKSKPTFKDKENFSNFLSTVKNLE